MAFFGLVRAIHPIGIELTGRNPVNPYVPHVAGAVVCRIEINSLGRRCVCGVIKKLQSNTVGVTAKQGKVHSSVGFMGSQRQRNAPAHFSGFADLGHVIIQRAFRRLHASSDCDGPDGWLTWRIGRHGPLRRSNSARLSGLLRLVVFIHCITFGIPIIAATGCEQLPREPLRLRDAV